MKTRTWPKWGEEYVAKGGNLDDIKIPESTSNNTADTKTNNEEKNADVKKTA